MVRQVFVFVVLLLPSLTNGSEIVFSNLGPGDSFAPLSSLLITGPDADLSGLLPGNYDAGVMFTVNQPQGFILDTVDVPLAYLEGTNSIALRIYNDDGGVPGTELGNVEVTGIPITATLLTANFRAQSISLMVGASYWVVGDAAQDTALLWHWNESGQLGGAYRTTGPWIREALGSTPALRVNGTAVPEMASFTLVTIAVFISLAVRRQIPIARGTGIR
jgi:hypothetical protein